MKTSSVPAGYHTITPAIVVHDGAAAIEFYQRIFGATTRRRMEMPNGKIMHAELVIGDSSFMLGDEMPDWGVLSPRSIGGTASTLQLYVEDADTMFSAAIGAGGEVVFPMTDQFWGDRSGSFKDPFGHKWMIATRTEEVSDEEMERRSKAWSQNCGG